ncbi:hypothetical protein OG21DRAFT_334480 [Imleria badia]|nr:hypothetical protein OG21DRAFT_334480 [Imleria badia]
MGKRRELGRLFMQAWIYLAAADRPGGNWGELAVLSHTPTLPFGRWHSRSGRRHCHHCEWYMHDPHQITMGYRALPIPHTTCTLNIFLCSLALVDGANMAELLTR